MKIILAGPYPAGTEEKFGQLLPGDEIVTVTDQAGHTVQSDVMYFEVKPADTAALTETIAAAEALDLTFYEDAGKEEFQAALDAAKALLEQEDGTAVTLTLTLEEDTVRFSSISRTNGSL